MSLRDLDGVALFPSERAQFGLLIHVNKPEGKRTKWTLGISEIRKPQNPDPNIPWLPSMRNLSEAQLKRGRYNAHVMLEIAMLPNIIKALVSLATKYEAEFEAPAETASQVEKADDRTASQDIRTGVEDFGEFSDAGNGGNGGDRGF